MAALDVARDLAEEGAIMPLLLFRTIETPSAIALGLARGISFAVEGSIDASQELFSHMDVVDLRAATSVASAEVACLLKLERLVAPGRAAVLRADARRLAVLVGSLPSVASGALDPTRLERVAQSMDALAATAGLVGGDVAGYGTGRDYA
jgi:hypothetical protein